MYGMFHGALAFNQDLGTRGPAALGGTQSPKGKLNHSAKVAAVGWDVDCLIDGREILLLSEASPALVWRGA
eukprot:2137915-Amphidinium_carterae.1